MGIQDGGILKDLQDTNNKVSINGIGVNELKNTIGIPSQDTQNTQDITSIFEWKDGGCICAVTTDEKYKLGEVVLTDKYAYSNFVDIELFYSLDILSPQSSISYSTAGICFYDNNKNAIEGVKVPTGNDVMVPLTAFCPKNTKYIRASVYVDNKQDFYCRGVYFSGIIKDTIELKNELRNLQNDTVDTLEKTSTIMLESTNIFHVSRNYMLKQETEDSNEVVYFSKDYGKSWMKIEKDFGDIMFVHFFSNGVCLICTKTECIYTKDFISFENSTVLDYDGTIIESNNFNSAFYHMFGARNDIDIINGKETLLWSDYYEISGYISRVWMTNNYGKTIKCICKNNETKIAINSEEITLSIRHFHAARWDKYMNCLWITTGDFDSQCKLIRGLYQQDEETFKFEEIISGSNAKFGDFKIDDLFLYLVTDFTSGQDTGIIRVSKYSDLKNIDNYEYIMHVPDNAAVVTYTEINGIKIIGPDGIGYKKIYIANGDMNLEKYNIAFANNEITGNFVLNICKGYNENGNCIYRVGTTGYDISKLRYNTVPGVDMAKTLRNYIPNFLKNNKLTR